MKYPLMITLKTIFVSIFLNLYDKSLNYDNIFYYDKNNRCK